MKKIVKWIDNFWYHHKFGTILWSLIIVIAVVAVVQFASRESYDYKVYLYISKGVTSETEVAFEDAFSQYGKDINGDGKVTVQMLNLSYDPSKSGNYQTSQATVLMGELQNADNYLFVTDDYRYDELCKMNLFSKSDILIDNTGFKSELLKAVESECDYQVNLDKLHLSVRKLPQNSNKSKTNTYNNAIKMVDKISMDKQ